jgi:hypothetical protein
MAMLIFGSLIIAFFIGRTAYEVATGKLLGRGWKPYETREQNPMVYWSTIALQIFLISAAVCIFGLALLSPKR